ncbi:MAG: hypothetical protein CMI02_16775, partial [Oceanospirillaceae bacterium]|nr:hypothetical protein [Oceanospirillaceae bacterium]
ISDLPEGTRASGPGHGWPMGRAVRKYRGFKEIRARKREAGRFLLLQNLHFRHPWRSGVEPIRREGRSDVSEGPSMRTRDLEFFAKV